MGLFANSALVASRWRYLFDGVRRRMSQSPLCPCCGKQGGDIVDRKLIYTLRRCTQCAILFRYPAEKSQEMADFYQEDYVQPEATDLPNDAELKSLIAGNFAGTDKDMAVWIGQILGLGIQKGGRVLDYGANWGYAVMQLGNAGFESEGYEISRPRARFADKLGVKVVCEIGQLSPPYDVCYSGHVLEHVPNPLASIQEQLGLLGEGGFVIARTPNGSEARRLKYPEGFRTHWGQVHPVLLSAEFIDRNFKTMPTFVDTESGKRDAIMSWDRKSSYRGALDGGELFFVIQKR